MIMTICASNNRNAIVDGYIGLVNHFPSKGEIIAVIPGVCSKEEFSEEIHSVVQENFRSKGKIGSKILCLIFYIKLAKLAKKENVRGIFIYSDSEWPNLIHIMMPSLRRIKTTVFIHDPKHHSGEQWVIKLIRNFVYPFYAKKALCLLSYENAIEELKRSHPIFKNARLRSVRLPGMAVMEFEDLKSAIEQGKVAFEYDLIFYGRLEAYKGVDLLLEANRYLQRSDRSVRILIVGGRGDLKNEVRLAAKSDHKVCFVDDYVSNRQLAEYIAKSKAVILPYRDATGTQTIQIANYYYKPVIVNCVGCFEEYVKEGQNGYFIRDMTPEGLGETIDFVLKSIEGQVFEQKQIYETADALFNIDQIAAEIETLIMT